MEPRRASCGIPKARGLTPKREHGPQSTDERRGTAPSLCPAHCQCVLQNDAPAEHSDLPAATSQRPAVSRPPPPPRAQRCSPPTTCWEPHPACAQSTASACSKTTPQQNTAICLWPTNPASLRQQRLEVQAQRTASACSKTRPLQNTAICLRPANPTSLRPDSNVSRSTPSA